MNAFTLYALSILVATTSTAQKPESGSAGAVESSTTTSSARSNECQSAPEGMVCIPAGPAVIGSDDHGPIEAPRHVVELSTYYLDKFEVTNGEYQACERARACPRRPRPRSYKLFQYKQQPAVPITWEMAQAYCVWAGKRLPTEAEWEKAARGGEQGLVYPWGNTAPTCEQANFKECGQKITRRVGTFPAGAYGVHELAGNGYEWVKDWATGCYGDAEGTASGCKKACGAACRGRDPRGPCDGADRCRGSSKRVLKGGSWYWPANQTRGSWRRAQYPKSGLHRLSFRCASSSPRLSAWPPAYLNRKEAKRPELSVPEPPSEAELAAFHDVVEDTDIFTIPECERVGKATVDCRDPMSYLTSNEALRYVFRRAVDNLGGAYVGIASDQSYSFIAAAKSRWAWIFDYDPDVIRVHHIIRAVILQAPDRKQFTHAFTKKRSARTIDWIREGLADQPGIDGAEIEATVRLYRKARVKLWSHYTSLTREKRWLRGFGWLRTDANYTYVKTMFEQGRIRALKGNMLTDVAMPSIAAAARKLGVPVRLYYTSNAEEQWRDLPEQYRKNVAALPFDDDTLALRTLFTTRYHQNASSKWHYVIHGGRHLQEHIVLPGYSNVWRFMEDRHMVGRVPSSTDESAAPRMDMLSHIGVPSSRP